MNKKSIFLKLYISGVLFAAGILLYILAANVGGFADGYSSTVYKFIVTVISAVTGIFPFSLYEIIILLTVAGAFFAIGRLIYLMIRKKGRRLSILASYGSTLLTIVTAVFFVFMTNSGVNYHRSHFADAIGLESGAGCTPEELTETVYYLAENANIYAGRIELDENNVCAEAETLRSDAVQAMRRLAEIYPVLDYPLPQPKAVICSHPMSMAYITGIFSPFTIEANYNRDNVAYNLPFVLCHELAHICGVMDEKEANFVAYLACINSDSDYFRFSGYANGLCYLLGDYAEVAGDFEYDMLFRYLHPQVLAEYDNENAYWGSLYSEGDDIFSEISNAVTDTVATMSETLNDAYLVVNGVEEGTHSSSLVSELIISDFLANRRAAE